MAIGIFEVKAPPAPTSVDLAIGVVVRPTAVRQSFGLHSLVNRLEFRVADVEGIVMALRLRLIGKIKGQTGIDLYLRKVAVAGINVQSKNLGKEFGGSEFVSRGHNR